MKRFVIVLTGFLLHFSLQAESLPKIAVASSLQFVLPEIAAAFKQRTGYAPRITYGSSGNFRRQITQGAPFQLFMSADEDYVHALTELGLTRDAGRVYALGRLAFVVPKGGPITLTPDFSFIQSAIERDELVHFSIANPDHAPYGRAARETLQSLDLWQVIQPYLVKGENASQAMQFAISGSSQGGLVPIAFTLSPIIAESSQILPVPASHHQPIRQRMVLLKDSGRKAVEFYEFINSAEAAEIFQRNGYEIPSSTDGNV